MTTETRKKKTFPWKLHEMLEMVHREGFEEVVSWLPDRKSFRVHDPAVFVEKIMPCFFDQSKYKSFQRQLNLWGFERLLFGPNKGGYFHPEFFLRDKPCEIHNIRRLKIKGLLSLKNKRKLERIGDAAKTYTTSIEIRRKDSSSGAASITSQGSCMDNNCDTSSTVGRSVGEHFSMSPPKCSTTPIPDHIISTLQFGIEDEYSPRTGDCIGFEGKSYFFIDEGEIEHTTNDISNITLPRNPPPRPPESTFSRPTPEAIVPTLPLHPNLSAANRMTNMSRRGVSLAVFADIRRRVESIVQQSQQLFVEEINGKMDCGYINDMILSSRSEYPGRSTASLIKGTLGEYCQN
mmetsp:Transcript_1490/g.3299  ORF Transcript_1490/g.3299 Transcript_1490/m.3299 type:complete len:348 (-) Transcript_1490:205-1248(-)